MPVKFAHDQFDVIQKIALRAVAMAKTAGLRANAMEFAMDVSATHANGCPLRLDELLAADDFNFAHDVFGIRQHLNRDTGRLGNCFLPRFARPRPVLAKASA